MPAIATLNTRLTLDTSRFTTGLGRATRAGRTFARGSSRAVGGVVRNYYNLRAIVTDVTRAIEQLGFAEIDASAKLADRTGIATERLAGYRLQAQLAGADTATLDKSLERFVRVLGDAAAGLPAQSKAFDTLGLSAERLAAMDTADAFEATVEAIARLPGPTERASAAYAVFGRQGQALGNFFAAGAEGLAAARAEADRLGLSFSRVDAAKVEEANDEIAKAKALAEGVQVTLAVYLAPVVAEIAERFTDAGAAGVASADASGSGYARLADIVGAVATAIDTVRVGFYFLRGAATAVIFAINKGNEIILRGTLAVAEAMGLPTGRMRENLSLVKAFNQDLRASMNDTRAEIDQAMDRLGRGPSSTATADFFRDVQARADAAGGSIDEAAASAAAAFDEAFASIAEQDEHTVTIDADTVALDAVEDRIADIDRELRTAGLTDIEVQLFDLEQLGATVEQLDVAREKLDQLADARAQLENREGVAETLGQLERELRLFGASESDRTIEQLREMGATAGEIERAAQLIEARKLREAAAEAATTRPGLQRAGSAEARAERFAVALRTPDAGRARPRPAPEASTPPGADKPGRALEAVTQRQHDHNRGERVQLDQLHELRNINRTLTTRPAPIVEEVGI